jgi:flagellar assembly protein FliH
MRIEPIQFREFSSESKVAAARKSNLPGGRRKEEAPPPPPAPTFSEEQMKAAEREGYKNGFLEGTKEGLQQAHNEQAAIDRALLETVEQFASTLTPLLADYRHMILQLKQDMPKVALTIAKKVAGNALDTNAAVIVENIATQCVQTMIGEPHIQVIVHSSLKSTLEAKFSAMSGRISPATDLTVIGSDTIALADCRVEWKHGAMERHTGQLWQEIEAVVSSLSASASRETEQHMENLAAQLSSTASPETGKD